MKIFIYCRFDENILLLQDTDFGLKINKIGKIILYYPESVIFISEKKENFEKNMDIRNKLIKNFYQEWLDFLINISKPYSLNLKVIWDLYCGCTGLNIEAIHFLLPLEQIVDISVIAGENCFCPGFPESVHDSLNRIQKRYRNIEQIDIFISHKPADKYPKFPYNGLIKIPNKPKYIIGRRY